MVSGSCLCGTVVFEVSGEVTTLSHCHCSMCRKVHGALFATYFDSTGLTIKQGQEAIASYASSSKVTRQFCKRCGSPLPEIITDSGDDVTVPAGLIDSELPNLPTKHIFTESKSSAYTITDQLPQVIGYGGDDTSHSAAVGVTPEANTPFNDDNANNESHEATSSSHTIEIPNQTNPVTGSCLCNAVTFEYEGTPEFVMNCHCTRCRKAKGAAHATNVFVTSEQFRWMTGEHHIESYAHPSATVFGHAFCKTCGSSVPRKRPGAELYNVPAGALNQSPGAEPKGHIYVGSMASWFDITDDKRQWQEGPI